MNWWKKKEKDPLSPDATPGGGGKRMSNAPLVIVVTVILLFASIIGYVMIKRTEQTSVNQTETASAKKGDGKGAEQAARELTEQWMPGELIPPHVPTESPQQPDQLKETNPSLGQAPNPPKQEPTPEKDLFLEDRLRVQQRRFQAFEAALQSKVSVQFSELRNRQPATTAMVSTQIAETRQRISNRSDLSRLSPGGASGVDDLYHSTATGKNDVRQFEQNDSWNLDSQIQAPASPYMLRTGFVIPATMISGINSNLPGQVMAQVSQNVWDTATGRFLLIPQGTRLIGAYSSDVAYGQERVLMAWQRLIFPDGKVLDIGAMPGADSAGYAGFSDKVNNHWFRTISSAVLMSGVIAAADMSQNDGNSNSNNDRQRASDALSEALGQTLGQTLGQIISKNLNIAPTLEIRPGYRFNVMVIKDMNFPGSYQAFNY